MSVRAATSQAFACADVIVLVVLTLLGEAGSCYVHKTGGAPGHNQ